LTTVSNTVWPGKRRRANNSANASPTTKSKVVATAVTLSDKRKGDQFIASSKLKRHLLAEKEQVAFYALSSDRKFYGFVVRSLANSSRKRAFSASGRRSCG
jgi:hypothetical protein